MKWLVAIAFAVVATHAAASDAQMQQFKEMTAKIQRDADNRAAAERPALAAKDAKAKQCILDAASALAATSPDAAHSVGLAAYDLCEDHVKTALNSYAVVFSNIGPERIEELKADWRKTWVDKATARVVALRAAR